MDLKVIISQLVLNVRQCLLNFLNGKIEKFLSNYILLVCVAAGPVGAGASVESGIDKTPIWSYVRSKGFYAGTELLVSMVGFKMNNSLINNKCINRDKYSSIDLMKMKDFIS